MRSGLRSHGAGDAWRRIEAEADRYCRNCGHELGPEDRFCQNCGQSTSEPVQASSLEEDVQTPPTPLGGGRAEQGDTDEQPRIDTPNVGVPPPPARQGSTVWRGVKLGFGGCVVLPVLLVLGFIGCLALFGGAGGNSGAPQGGSGEQVEREEAKQGQATPDQPRDVAQEEVVEEEAVEEPEPITLSGSGQQATEPFQLEQGLTVVRMNYQGGGNFIVDLFNESGRSVAPMGVANEIGRFEGSTPVQIRRAGEHILDVQASGPWEITVEQPRTASAPEKTSFSGDSKAATQLFQLSEGLHTFQMTHQGNSNFIVDLLDENGRSVTMMGLVNEIGRFDGSKAVRVPRDGLYLLSVEANGPWTIEID